MISTHDRKEDRCRSPKDQALFEDACARLVANGFFDVPDLEFDVVDGRLVLQGTVERWHQKQLIQESLKPLRPVLTICNEIEVAPRATGRHALPSATSDRRFSVR